MFLDHLLDEHGRPRGLPVEVETRIEDVQAQFRRIALKLRDAELDAVLVVVGDTPSNRRAVAASRSALAGMFPVSPRMAFAALAEGRHPGGSSLVFT
jgi:hypothetical protein